MTFVGNAHDPVLLFQKHNPLNFRIFEAKLMFSGWDVKMMNYFKNDRVAGIKCQMGKAFGINRYTTLIGIIG